jgi:hypothetical protein
MNALSPCNIRNATAESFAIPARPEAFIQSSIPRLWYIDTTRTVKVRNNVAGPFLTEERFYAEALSDEIMWVRKYTIVGYPNIVFYVPLKDLDTYDQVRSQRYAAGAVPPEDGWTALPEDVVAFLDDLPDATLFSVISLYLDHNPVDDWPREINKHDENWHSSAATINDRELAFFRVSHYGLRFCGIHECFHRLANLYPEIFKILKVARYLDSTYIPDPYAHVSEEEHATTFGQNLLGLDGEWFLNVVKGGPFRSFILMMMVERWLKEASETSAPCRCHEGYLRRIEFARAYAEMNVGPFIRRVQTIAEFLSSNGIRQPSPASNWDELVAALRGLLTIANSTETDTCSDRAA